MMNEHGSIFGATYVVALPGNLSARLACLHLYNAFYSFINTYNILFYTF